MKHTLIFALSLIILTFTNCGPAAEDRVASDARNKIIQDSMTNSIQSRIDQPMQIMNEAPLVQPTVKDTAKK